jgi:hypothetical protein
MVEIWIMACLYIPFQALHCTFIIFIGKEDTTKLIKLYPRFYKSGSASCMILLRSVRETSQLGFVLSKSKAEHKEDKCRNYALLTGSPSPDLSQCSAKGSR